MKDLLYHNRCLTKGISASFFFFCEERHIWERSPGSFHQPSVTLNYSILNSKRLESWQPLATIAKNSKTRCTHFRPKDKRVCRQRSVFTNLFLRQLDGISDSVRCLLLFLDNYEILMSGLWWSESTQTLLLCNGPPLCLLLHLCHPHITPSSSVQ